MKLSTFFSAFIISNLHWLGHCDHESSSGTATHDLRFTAKAFQLHMIDEDRGSKTYSTATSEDSSSQVRYLRRTLASTDVHQMTLDDIIDQLLDEDEDNPDCTVLLFHDNNQVDSISDEDIEGLLALFDEGSLILGRHNDPSTGAAFREKFGLHVQGVDPNKSATNGEDAWIALYRGPRGNLHELMVNVDPRDSVEDSISRIVDWYVRQSAAVSDGTRRLESDPWNAIHTFEYSATTYGTFEGSTDQTVGTHRFTAALYYIATSQDNDDWYRIDYDTYSEITNYEKTGDSTFSTSGKCGWATDSVHVVLTVETDDGEWYEYMPYTTVGSSETSFSIGGSIGSDNDVSGEYSKSYGTEDVEITVQADTVNNTIAWKASLEGCHDYSLYPFYSGASSAAKTTYDLDPSAIVRVPSGSYLEIGAKLDDGTKWDFVAKKTKLTLDFLEVEEKVYETTYWETPTFTCTTSGCQ